MGEPLVRRGSGLLAELARESARRHRRVAGQILHAQSLAQMRLRPLQERREPSSRPAVDGVLDVLRLTAVAVRRHDQPAGHAVGDFGAIIAPDDVQAKVYARGAARRSQNAAFIHVQNAGVDANLRKPGSQLFRIAPVGGGALAIEQPSGRKNEGSGTNGDQTCAASVRRTQCFKERFRRRFAGSLPARNNDGSTIPNNNNKEA